MIIKTEHGRVMIDMSDEEFSELYATASEISNLEYQPSMQNVGFFCKLVDAYRNHIQIKDFDRQANCYKNAPLVFFGNITGNSEVNHRKGRYHDDRNNNHV